MVFTITNSDRSDCSMDDFTKGLIVAMIVVLFFFGMLFAFLQAQHRWNVGRDVHLMENCKILTQVVGSASVKEYKCKEQ
jgi:hypothetical protein